MYNLGIWIARLRISHFRATRATPFVACVPWPPTTVRTLLVLVRGTLWSPNPITWTGIECSTTVSGPIFFREIPSESAMATLEIGPEVLRLVPPSPPPPPPPPRKHRSMVWFHAWSIGLGFFELLKKITILPSCFFFYQTRVDLHVHQFVIFPGSSFCLHSRRSDSEILLYSL